MIRGVGDSKGFTLVEIMMVVIIIGILAVLAIPKYEKYTIESKLSEVAVAVGEIKTGMEKYYNSHGNEYPAFTTKTTGIEWNGDLEKLLRIDLGGQENFVFEINTGHWNTKTGYMVTAYLTETGINRAYASSDRWDRVKYYFPKDANANWQAPEWKKGWCDDDFFTQGFATTAGL